MPFGRLNRDLRATLPIDQLKGKPQVAVCPILNVHRCKVFIFLIVLMTTKGFTINNNNYNRKMSLRTFESYDSLISDNLLKKSKGFVKLIRPENLLPTLTLNLAGGWLAQPSFNYLINSKQFFIGTILTSLIMSLSMVTNDICDIEVDKTNNPSRPLVAGDVTKKEAIIFAGVIIGAIQLLNIFMMSPVTQISTNWALFMVLVYTPLLKRMLIFKNVSCATLVAFSLYYTGNIVATDGIKNQFLLNTATKLIFWGSLQNEILLDIADTEGDKKNGILTIPVVFGKQLAFMVSKYIVYFNILWNMYYSMSREYSHGTGLLMLFFCSPLTVGLRNIKKMNYEDSSVRDVVKSTTKPMIIALLYLCVLRATTK
jgi:geranylgeranylglycerol-phosphate geranylgeranyltransferase